VPELLQPKILQPRTTGELIKVLTGSPDTFLLAGGTSLYTGLSPSPTFQALVNLYRYEELHRIYKTEKYLEIGACVTLAELLGLSEKFLPEIFGKCLRGIASPPVRNTATIGGSLAYPGHSLDLFHLFILMDVSIEIRTPENPAGQWISASYFYNLKKSAEAGPFIITRVRIPSESYNTSYYCKLPDPESRFFSKLLFMGLARQENDVLQDFRLVIGLDSKELFRDRQLEISIMGRRIPHLDNDQDFLKNGISKILETSDRAAVFNAFMMISDFIRHIVDHHYASSS
jgi:CO/xanthine dehydrogenase FAD-binding subunit